MPAPTDRVLSALRIADPAAWRAKVRTALRAEGTVPGAAASLGIARATLFRWVSEDPGVREGLDLPDRPGPRPKGK
ncbi:MAG: hypothetical protein JWM10_2565 [Myxococcaceae bacterium]|nr:hypothetical protein [Myxococcaceae bacterium]